MFVKLGWKVPSEEGTKRSQLSLSQLITKVKFQDQRSMIKAFNIGFCHRVKGTYLIYVEWKCEVPQTFLRFVSTDVKAFVKMFGKIDFEYNGREVATCFFNLTLTVKVKVIALF